MKEGEFSSDLLLPMSMITMLLLLCCLASSSHVVCVERGVRQKKVKVHKYVCPDIWIPHQVVESVSPRDVVDISLCATSCTVGRAQ